MPEHSFGGREDDSDTVWPLSTRETEKSSAKSKCKFEQLGLKFAYSRVLRTTKGGIPGSASASGAIDPCGRSM